MAKKIGVLKQSPEEVLKDKESFARFQLKNSKTIATFTQGLKDKSSDKSRKETLGYAKDLYEEKKEIDKKYGTLTDTEKIEKAQANVLARIDYTQKVKKPGSIEALIISKNPNMSVEEAIEIKKGLANPSELALIATSLGEGKESVAARKILGRQQERKLEIAGLGRGLWKELTKDEQNVHYDSYLKTGKAPPLAFRDPESRNAFNKGFAAYVISNGTSNEDVASIRSQYSSLSKSLDGQQKRRGAMGSFVDNVNRQVDRVGEIEKEIKRTGYRVANKAYLVVVRDIMGEGSEAAFKAYLLEISSEIAKLAGGAEASVREPSEYSQQKWDKIHDETLPYKELAKVLKETKHMANFRLASVDKELKRTLNIIRGLGTKKAEKSVSEMTDDELLNF